jgi:DNA-binding LacI/PurR family transcriptional regulator
VPASIEDVALRAGVSTATVSHVLNGTRRTRPHTRQRVLAAIRELGYAQNEAARNLARGRSSVLGLVISDIRNPFFPEITSAFQDQAVANNMDAMVINTNYDAPRLLNSVKRLIGLQVPGVAILTSQIDPSVMDVIAGRNIAAVYLDLGKVARFISNITIDYEHGIAEALEHLTALGHRRIGYIGGPPHLHSAKRRKTAFIETAARLGLGPEPMIDADFTVRGGYFAFGKLLQQGAPSAVMAANDLMAIGVLHRAREDGLRVPGDLSVVGFDDILFAEYAEPGLTTVAVPRPQIGRVAFEALWALMEDPESSGREFRVATTLVTRQSSAPPCPSQSPGHE